MSIREGGHPSLSSRADLEQLIAWLGPEGAVSGLERSMMTNADLMLLARKCDVAVAPKSARRQMVIELVMMNVQRIDKSPDYLLSMSQDELKRYLSDRMVSNAEMHELLRTMGIAPTGKIRGKMLDYTAREVSELGVFERVAKGDLSSSRKAAPPKP